MHWLYLLSCFAHADDESRATALDRMYATYAVGLPKVQTISAAALRSELGSQNPPVLIDVRPDNERQVSMLPGAISLETFEANRAVYADRAVVTYCTIGVRSAYVARDLDEQGVSVSNFKGSILAWTHIGGPLQTPAGEPTTAVHVYGPRWNYAHSAYQPYVGDPPKPLSVPSTAGAQDK